MGLVSKRGGEDEQQGNISIAGLDLPGDKPAESVYELDDWSDRGRTMLRERLETLGVPHHWEEPTSLVISEPDEAWVERIMDQVEDDLSIAVDPEVPQIAYDLAEWDSTWRARLFERLQDEAVPYGTEGDELYVHEIDEQRVDEMIDSIVEPPDGTDAAAPTDGGPEVMGELFVAADRVARDPSGDGSAALVEALDRATGSAVPYGMDQAWWGDVLAKARELVALVAAADDADDDVNHDAREEVVAEAAKALRDGLRPYV
jgi:hypothetical protein